MEYVNLQFSSFLILFIAGSGLGILIDIYRVMRSQLKLKGFFSSIGDFLFWVLATFFIIPLLYWSTWLELRFYVWLSLGLGLIFYYSMFSRALIPVILKTWRFLTWGPRQIGRFWRVFFKIFKQLRNFIIKKYLFFLKKE